MANKSSNPFHNSAKKSLGASGKKSHYSVSMTWFKPKKHKRNDSNVSGLS